VLPNLQLLLPRHTHLKTCLVGWLKPTGIGYKSDHFCVLCARVCCFVGMLFPVHQTQKDALGHLERSALHPRNRS